MCTGFRGDEMRALRQLRRDYLRDAHIHFRAREANRPIGFHRLIQRLGGAAKMPFPIHPHMLRHACGFKLANDGHDTRACSTTSATRTSSTPSGTPRWRPKGQGFLERLRSPARRQWRLALSRLALPRANRSVGLRHQPVRPALGRLEHGECRRRYRRSLYCLTVDHLGLVASRAAVKPVLNDRDVGLNLLGARSFISVCVLDLVLAGTGRAQTFK